MDSQFPVQGQTIKAFIINWNKIKQGNYYKGNITHIYADNINKARYILLQYIDGYELKYSNEPITYLNIPVIRCKEYDKHLYKGSMLTTYQIEEQIRQEKRNLKLQKILNNDSISHCYIKKRGSYYRPNSCGYTDIQSLAGVYDKIDAVQEANSCDELLIIPIDIVKHNELINQRINELKSRLL